MKCMKRTNLRSGVLLLLALFLFACSPDENDFEYEKANSENIYEVLQQDGNFKLLLEAVDTLKYSDALKYTLNTVLAPRDEVFQAYLDEKGYASIGDFPKDELQRLIEHHVLTWLYPSGQFKDNPEMFRRETKVIMPDQLEEYDDKEYLIRKENKFMAFLTPAFFEAYGGSAADYEVFYGKPLGEMSVYGSSITKLDWLAGNGWIHVVDKMVEPVRNLHDWLTTEEDYSLFASLVDRYRVLSSTSADEDGNSRFYNHSDVIPNVHYLHVGFWPDNESFGSSHQSSQFLSMFAYDNEAMGDLFSDYLSESFNSYDDVPDFIVRAIITPTLFIDKVILPSNITEGQLTKDNDIINFDIEDKSNKIEFCSNGIVYGSTKYQIPRSFSSLLKPCYTDTTFSYYAQMLASTGFDKVLNEKENKYTVFMPSDDVFNADSIIMDAGMNFYHLKEDGNRGAKLKQPEIANIVLSSIIVNEVEQVDQTQYIKCIGGWYLGIAKDSVWSGANWKKPYPVITSSIEAPEIDNGTVHYVDHYVAAPQLGIANVIAENEEYSAFYSLCDQAGLFTTKGNFSFFAYPSKYSVFVPTNEVLAASFPLIPQDSVGRIEFILNHFVEGDIYSDGEVSGVLNSALPNAEASTDFEVVYKSIEVLNSINDLQVKGSANSTPLKVDSNDNFSNVICTDGVVHRIDGVLLNLQN